MNKHILALLIVTNCIFIAQGMFGQQCDAAAANYHEKENEKREKERERSADIEGLTLHKLSDLGFLLRSKHHNKEYIMNFFDKIDVYMKDDGFYLIDFHLDGFKSYHLLQDLVKDKIQYSYNLAEILSGIGVPCSWELNKLLFNCVKDEKGTFIIDAQNLSAVAQSSDEDKDEEDKEQKNQPIAQISNLFQRIEKRKSALASLVPHLCSMSFGFALAVPCCYALYLKMGK